MDKRRLQRLGAVALLMAAIAVASGDQSISLTWDPDPDFVGYTVYYGTSSGSYPHKVYAGTDATVTISGLTEGKTYCFAVSGHDASGLESELSEEIVYLVPGGLKAEPVSNGTVRIHFSVAPLHSYEIQATEDLMTWTKVWETNAIFNQWAHFEDLQSNSFQARFYRLILD